MYADNYENRKEKGIMEILTPLEQAVYDFTLENLTKIIEAGVNVTMIQVGNELSNGLLWPEGNVPNYDNIAKFVNAGIRACRKVNADIPIMILILSFLARLSRSA